MHMDLRFAHIVRSNTSTIICESPEVMSYHCDKRIDWKEDFLQIHIFSHKLQHWASFNQQTVL